MVAAAFLTTLARSEHSELNKWRSSAEKKHLGDYLHSPLILKIQLYDAHVPLTLAFVDLL